MLAAVAAVLVAGVVAVVVARPGAVEDPCALTAGDLAAFGDAFEPAVRRDAEAVRNTGMPGVAQCSYRAAASDTTLGLTRFPVSPASSPELSAALDRRYGQLLVSRGRTGQPRPTWLPTSGTSMDLVLSGEPSGGRDSASIQCNTDGHTWWLLGNAPRGRDLAAGMDAVAVALECTYRAR